MKPIRNSAKAVIVQNDKVLLTKNVDREGFFYLFPGGGQEKFETLQEAVIRECVEEIGRPVQVEDLLFIREYIGRNHQFAEWDADVHQVEFYFRCSLSEAGADGRFEGNNPDSNQVGVEWVELNRMEEIRIYPAALGVNLKQGVFKSIYLGDTN